MPRSGARPRFVGQRSTGWTTPVNPESGAAPSAPEPDDIQRPSADAPPVTATIGHVPVQAFPPNVLGFDRAEHLVNAAAHLPQPHVPTSGFQESLLRERGLALQLGAVTNAEVDRLWDWARADRAGVQNFMGVVPDFSIDLFKWVGNFQAVEAEGRAWFRAIYVGGAHVGFVMLMPVVRATTGIVGDCHIYLTQEARGSITSLLPALMAEADRLIPQVTLRVVTARDDEWSRLLQSVGFVAQIVLTRPPTATGASSGS